MIYFIFITCSFAQGEKNRLLSVKQMQKDLRYFYKTVLNVHPNPYQVLSPEQLDIKVHELLQSIDKPLSRLDFFLKVGVLNSCFDYHTQINRNIEFWKVYRNFFPPYFINLKDSVFCFVKNSNLDSSLWGAKINTINHISCEELTALSKPYVSFEDYHCFPFDANIFFMQHLLHGIQDTIMFEYEKKKKKGMIKFNVEECIKLWEFAGNENGVLKDKLPFNYKIFKDDSIAVLELNSFLEEKIDPQQYSDFLNHFFDTIHSLNIQHLFIDISANSGGNDNYGYQAFEYFIKDSIYYLGKLVFKTSKERKFFLRKYDKDQYHDYLKKAKNKSFFSNEVFWIKKTPEEMNLYKNNVYLIQSWQTASAASNIVNFIKVYKIGVTIGTEISDGIAFYGNVLYFKMKYSKLDFTCASSYWRGVGGSMKTMKERIQSDVTYPILNPSNNFLIEQLKEMLLLVDEYKNQKILKY
jgi:hypothetical protein